MKDVIELAKQAGLEFQAVTGITGKTKVTTCGSQPIEKIELLIKLVRNAALEEAAQKCENNHRRFKSYTGTLREHDEDIAVAIRNLRSQHHDTHRTKNI